MKKILITGGSGFIGSHFDRTICGERIVNFDLVPPSYSARGFYVRGDVRRAEDLDKALSEHACDAIICLAAEHKDFGFTREAYFATNEGGTRNICDAAANYGIKTIVFYSSVAVYGPVTNFSNEETPTLPTSHYGQSKLAGEEVLAAWTRSDASRRALIIRPTVVIGEGNLANMLRLIRQIDAHLYVNIGGGKNVKSIAYVTNLVEATLFLFNRIKPGIDVYNYADEPHLTVDQITETIAASLGRPKPLSLPFSLVYALAMPFDLLVTLFGRDLPVSTDRIKKICTATQHHAHKIHDAGFSRKWSSQQGLERMVSWYSQKRASGKTPIVAVSSSG